MGSRRHEIVRKNKFTPFKKEMEQKKHTFFPSVAFSYYFFKTLCEMKKKFTYRRILFFYLCYSHILVRFVLSFLSIKQLDEMKKRNIKLLRDKE